MESDQLIGCKIVSSGIIDKIFSDEPMKKSEADKPINLRIQAAIRNTMRYIPGRFEDLIESRLPYSKYGNCVEERFKNPPHLRREIEDVHWEPYDNSDFLPYMTGFITHDIKGRMGIVKLKYLSPTKNCRIEDRLGTGQAQATVVTAYGKKVDFSVIILEEDDDIEVVRDFHPGPPIVPSTKQIEPGLDGKVFTAQELMDMGFTHAKIIDY